MSHLNEARLVVGERQEFRFGQCMETGDFKKSERRVLGYDGKLLMIANFG
jgi:hypothetical protein